MAAIYENNAWAQVKEGWRQLYGSFSRQGVSVENHEFEAASDLNWGRSFHRNSVELCLNLRGNGTVDDGRLLLQRQRGPQGPAQKGRGALVHHRRAFPRVC
jgi:hypothetical protein